MKFRRYLMEIQTDSEDWGAGGKKYEEIFSRACTMVGLKFTTNRYGGRAWDIHPEGSGWEKLVSDKDVNIKISGTKWMFGSVELGKMLPWEKLPKKFNVEKAAAMVKQYIKKIDIDTTVFMKAKNKEIQQQIIDAVKSNDAAQAEALLVKKNFNVEKLGKDYTVRILTDTEKVTSIAIDKGGRVFMRSEKPRKIGGSSGMVTFRTPTAKLGKVERKIKIS